jgi:hypothetical protein
MPGRLAASGGKLICEPMEENLAMHDSTPHPVNPRILRSKEYEDPHYHDDDSLGEEDTSRPRAPQQLRKPARQIPSPSRRRYEDD